ncbi:hypothetical protein WDV91_08595 [Curtobacterium flaccumfaciens pv. flaccumfaciens]
MRDGTTRRRGVVGLRHEARAPVPECGEVEHQRAHARLLVGAHGVESETGECRPARPEDRDRQVARGRSQPCRGEPTAQDRDPEDTVGRSVGGVQRLQTVGQPGRVTEPVHDAEREPERLRGRACAPERFVVERVRSLGDEHAQHERRALRASPGERPDREAQLVCRPHREFPTWPGHTVVAPQGE